MLLDQLLVEHDLMKNWEEVQRGLDNHLLWEEDVELYNFSSCGGSLPLDDELSGFGRHDD